MQIREDPGSEMEKIRIRDSGWKKNRIWDSGSRIRYKHPGSATLDFRINFFMKNRNKEFLDVTDSYFFSSRNSRK